MKKAHDNWFYLAGEDLQFAKAGFEDGFYAHVCFLAQQAVEKAMKGYLVAQNKRYPKSHNLQELHKLMQVPWLEEYLAALKNLSDFYIPLRYPDAIAGSLPNGLPQKEEAKDALKWAEEIVAAIQKHI